MKNLFLILILTLFSCKSKKLESNTLKPKFELGIDVVAKVSKIDSIANYYLVLVENKNEYLKIVSDKNQAKYYNGIKVDVGKYYKFRIQQITNRQPPDINDTIMPVNYLDIAACRNFGKTKICTESSYELAKASNLRGLHLRKD
ncbi:hypothetical protein [Olleya marilimosa]|jgi:hypothetical protein|uniref:Lipoprotein n=1 Tax=Olleya marilimosa TaxID=272164 RepID=A0ABR8M397_9FLAO|nr:hypothetical protein [Olleya marilimosa]MBD3864702.1 hypothetical protein [Olleya marilimosa]